ncbi:MAG: MFS transporter [Verrucomicrobiota bacterium]|nr:MFS transporter [Verrucomicrobiota bacterium]
MDSTAASKSTLTRGQWMVLLAAFLGWLFDGFELGLFPVVARSALLDLLKSVDVEAADKLVGPWNARINACFLLGAASGGLVFGWLGDRIGRVRALALSILTYSLFTGFSYFAQAPWQLGVLRFVGALGMGGEWSLGVALVMECWPERLRPLLAGAIGAAANFGFLLTGVVASLKHVTVDSWRWMFLVGALPAFLVFFVIICVPESERWKAAVRRESARPVREIFSGRLLGPTLLAIAFASVALIGTWGSVQWLPLWSDQLAGRTNPGAKAQTQMVQAFGAIVGCFVAPLAGARLGRRPSYFLLCLASLLLCGYMFRAITEFNLTFLLLAFGVSLATASFYGWFPLYFPELFPTRARATGQGLAFNFGRVFAAGGALLQGELVAHFEGSYARAGAVVTLVYLVGMALIWLAPETKGKPLPE